MEGYLRRLDTFALLCLSVVRDGVGVYEPANVQHILTFYPQLVNMPLFLTYWSWWNTISRMSPSVWIFPINLPTCFGIHRQGNPYESAYFDILVKRTYLRSTWATCQTVFSRVWVRPFTWNIGDFRDRSSVAMWKKRTRLSFQDWIQVTILHIGSDLQSDA